MPQKIKHKQVTINMYLNKIRKEANMELKNKYQYTYFIYPYMIKEKEYNKYLRNLLFDSRFTMKIFDKEKDEDIYSYFLPKVKNTLFWTMDFDKYRISKLNDIDKDMQATLISRYPCTMFEYNIQTDIQGKAGEKDGIFFNINKMELVCFNTGICFLLIKTMLEGETTLSDVCNFNYKFRDIKSDTYNLKGYENIKIQTDMFNDIKEIATLIKDITRNNKEASKLNIDTNRFITYSYVCLEQESWNNSINDEIKEREFYKFANVEKADYIVDRGKSGIKEKMSIIEKTKNELYGISNVGTVLLTSDINSENCTKVPYQFERQYLYHYIYELYEKIYLNKINYEFKRTNKISQTKKEFVNFTQSIWIEEVTNENIGGLLGTEWKKVLKLNSLYLQAKNKYDLVYKNSNIEKTMKISGTIAILLGILIIINLVGICKILQLVN